MKLSVTFDEEERTQVLKVVELVKTIFPGARVRPPKIGNDWKLHIHITSKH